MADNTMYVRGTGNWVFRLYQPDGDIGPFPGSLIISKEFHTVEARLPSGEACTVVSVPSQNIAYVVNTAVKAK